MNCIEAKRLENLIIEGDEEAELREYATKSLVEVTCEMIMDEAKAYQENLKRWPIKKGVS
jgi:hypothetical protein